MDSFEAREHAAESFFAHELEEQFLTRMARVATLGDWANRAMAASPEGAAQYLEILRTLAISTPDDSVLVERVSSDLAAASVYLPNKRVADIFAQVGTNR